MDKKKKIVAYFSLELALDNRLKTYAGGLGVLAGDILRSAADVGFPMVGVSLLNRQGYFKQTVNASGEQILGPEEDFDYSLLKKKAPKIKVKIGGENITLRVWEYKVKGANGFSLPAYLLDSNLSENTPANQTLTDRLYVSDKKQRLKQEIILGRGGVKVLSALGYKQVAKYHLNEGHGSLAALELFLKSKRKSLVAKVKEVRSLCVFTVHTPLPSAQDVFKKDFFLENQSDWPRELKFLFEGDKINLTKVGLYFGGYINGVSKRHQAVSRKIFPGFKIFGITNGTNAFFWVSEELGKIYDRYLPGWTTDYQIFKQASKIPIADIWQAHQGAKKRLLKFIKKHSGQVFQEDVFTIGFARRFASYKRADFLFKDLDKLLKLSRRFGKLQVIFAGKAHQSDEKGQTLIKKIFEFKKSLAGKIEIAFLEDYNMGQAKLLVAGTDLWLNTPLPPFEASATSGMKAAQNGVPQLSTFDGWWREAKANGRTGWTIKESQDGRENNLYDLLEKDILLLYYKQPEAWQKIMRSTIALNAPVFNTARVLRQYNDEAYKLKFKFSAKRKKS